MILNVFFYKTTCFLTITFSHKYTGTHFVYIFYVVNNVVISFINLSRKLSLSIYTDPFIVVYGKSLLPACRRRRAFVQVTIILHAPSLNTMFNNE